jgi:uncharacterized protein (TIGR03435 family)
VITKAALRKSNQSERKLDGLAYFSTGLILAFFGVLSVAQAPVAAADHEIAGTWQGTLRIPATAEHSALDLRLVNKVSRANDGKLSVAVLSIDQGGGELTASSASLQDGIFKYEVPAIQGNFEGKISADGKSIAGSWTQGGTSLPLLMERATPETAWTIPPVLTMRPMVADANPSFEVATIKPSSPDAPGRVFGVRGNHFRTIDTTLTDLITFAYGVQQKQVAGQPRWVDTDKWDIEAQPDVPGAPNKQQLATMVQKLLASRFHLKFHEEARGLSVYELTVAAGGQKMTAGSTDPNQLPGLFFPELGSLTAQNSSMQDFANLLQTTVLDRPVVDHTGLKGKWNFVLKWTPDETQFPGMGIKVTPPGTLADEPPPLAAAIQQQLGLKLTEGKALLRVLEIDKAEKPSVN